MQEREDDQEDDKDTDKDDDDEEEMEEQTCICCDAVMIGVVELDT